MPVGDGGGGDGYDKYLQKSIVDHFIQHFSVIIHLNFGFILRLAVKKLTCVEFDRGNSE